MHFIRLIKSQQKKFCVSGIQVEISEAYCNLPTVKIDSVQVLNTNNLSAQVFETEQQALNAVVQELSPNTTCDVKWFQKGVRNVFIARLLTDYNGSIATDQDISQWKSGTLQLKLMDVYVTLDCK